MPDTDTDTDPDHRPPAINYILSFLLVGLAWGLTTPFIRRAARAHKPDPSHAAILDRPAVQASWLRRTLYGAFFGVVDLLRNPRYAVPLVLNLTGSIWFFLLIGKAGEWLVEGKVISRETGIGMVLSLAGIALCVQSKN
ncbi:integral membrane protein [Trichoderma gamsii]|uniref:Integral membrane protein n=1 Tax=Trichoderma gamsii TaxID=398673 RepID=A0A2P4ZYD6_9HYPO|nr:integral membrane protein [Trichoderma gamsii]PON29296.1 integral membrane protein [Trichoderma gamsii]